MLIFSVSIFVLFIRPFRNKVEKYNIAWQQFLLVLILISVFRSVCPLVSILENEMTIDDGYFGIHSK